MHYRADIDGLRAVAVLSVLVFHALPDALPGGFVGVDIFFVISGFLISGIVMGDLEKGRFSIANFYNRRIRRIFPALILVMAVSLALGSVLLFPDELRQLGKHIGAGTTFLSNLVLWRESGYFDAAADKKPLLHLWSLAVEEQFYIFWPLLLAAIWKRRASFLAVTAVVGVASFITCLVLLDREPTAAFYWPISRFWELMIGGALAYTLLHRPDLHARARDLQSVVGAVLIAAAFALIDKHSAFPGWWALLPTLGAYLLISAGPTGLVNRTLLSSKAAVGIGLISYPLYLWHWPLLTYLRIASGHGASEAALVAALVVAGVLAWLTYAVFEKRLRFAPGPMVPAALVGGFALLFVLATGLFFTGGLPERDLARKLDFARNNDVFEGSRNSDGSCGRRLGLPALLEEVCLTTSDAPRTLFAGDSHAMALYSGVYAHRVGLDAAIVAGHGCPFFPTLSYTPTHESNFGNNCTAIAKQALDLALRQPSIESVLLVNALPPLDDQPSRFHKDGRELTNEEAFLVGMGDVLEALSKTSKRLIFVIDVPHLMHDPRDCVQRVPFVSAQDCADTPMDHVQIRKRYRAILTGLQRRYPALNVYDPTDFFCEGARCRYQLDGKYLYNDTHHLSTHGSELLLRRMGEIGLLGVNVQD